MKLLQRLRGSRREQERGERERERDRESEGEHPEVRHVSIPLDAASVFRTVALTRGSYVGPLPPDALTQHYLALLGRSPRAVSAP